MPLATMCQVIALPFVIFVAVLSCKLCSLHYKQGEFKKLYGDFFLDDLPKWYEW